MRQFWGNPELRFESRRIAASSRFRASKRNSGERSARPFPTEGSTSCPARDTSSPPATNRLAEAVRHRLSGRGASADLRGRPASDDVQIAARFLFPFFGDYCLFTSTAFYF